MDSLEDTTHNLSEENLLEEYNDDFRMTVLPVTIFFGIEALFGIVGNVLVLYVFSCHYKKCNFRYFVLCLAIVDLSGCIASILGEMVSQLFWYNYPWELLPVCKIKCFFNQFTICAEAGLLVVIAVDRYRKVCQPFGWQIKENNAIVLCIIIYVIASILGTPAPILWGMHSDSVTYRGRNIKITVCERDEKYRDTYFILGNIILNHSLIFITMVSMVVMYIMIARKLIIGQHLIKQRRSHCNRGQAKESSTENTTGTTGTSGSACVKMDSNIISDDETSTGDKLQQKYQKQTLELNKMVKIRRKTMIMLYLTAVFVVTTLIYSILIASIAGGKLPEDNTKKAVFLLFVRFYFINHVVNPVIYGLMDKHFQLQMTKLRKRLCRICSK